jgi:ABC-type phosphate transport system substrate-binding protein
MTRKLLASTILASALSFSAAHATTTINVGGSSLAGPTYVAEFKAYTTANPTILFSYEAVGSGGGQKAFLSNDITQFEGSNVTSSTLTYGTIVGTQIDIGASDIPLVSSSSQITNPATGSYANSTVDGPLIQIPSFGVPITLAYNESLVPSAGLTLTDAKVCGILSGEITDWHTLIPAIPAGTTIHVVYFSNSSGTTYLLTQHLNAVCNSSNSSFPSYPVPITKYFQSTTSSNHPVFATVPANFTGESASSAVAAQVLATSGGFTYISPDFTSIAPLSASTTTLKVAKLVNATNGVAYLPTVANTITGLAHAGTGAINTTPPATLAAAQDPLNWIPQIPQTTAGYPIVGYGGLELSSCYASKPAGAAINKFLSNQYKSAAYQTIIKNNGFVPLINTVAVKYASAVIATFLSNTSGYALNINNATTCATYTGR